MKVYDLPEWVAHIPSFFLRLPMKLDEFFKNNPKVAIAFSGGVDSAYLLYAAKTYGAEVKAYYVASEFQPEFEKRDALKLAQELRIDIQVLPLQVLHNSNIRKNPKDRCYYCKKQIFSCIAKAAAEDGFAIIVDGSNASDDAGDRAGMRVLEEMSIRSPLRDVPIYSGHICSELCTPTGAALLKYFASSFGHMPVMTVKKIGYGMGKKDFEAANCVRVLLGETDDKVDVVAELYCNIDDMTAEAIGFAMEKLFCAGALEVYTIPVGMKKSRLGTLLCVMCRADDKDKMIRIVFKHTTTIGIRERISNRYTLQRRIETVDTAFGAVRKKISSGYGVQREKYEYEDLAEIARKEEMSIADVLTDICEN